MPATANRRGIAAAFTCKLIRLARGKQEIMHRTFSFRFVHIALYIFVALVPAYSATVLTYGNSDASVFNSITTGMTTIDFDAQAASPNTYNYSFSSNGFLLNGTRFLGISDADGNYFTAAAWTPNSMRDWSTNAVLEGPAANGDPERRLHITLPNGGATAIGMDLMTWLLSAGVYHSGGNFTVTLSTGDIVPVATAYWISTLAVSPKAAGISPAWLGIASDTPITWLDIRSSEGTIVMDNFSFGTANLQSANPPAPPEGEVPEASTFIMIGTGLAALRMFRKSVKLQAV